MSTKNENIENDLVQRWLTYAKSDLELAKVSLPESVLLETLCYHAQQAAEKALIRESAILTEYAVSSRYPSFVEPVEIDDYEFALALADRVFLWSSRIIETKV